MFMFTMICEILVIDFLSENLAGTRSMLHRNKYFDENTNLQIVCAEVAN